MDCPIAGSTKEFGCRSGQTVMTAYEKQMKGYKGKGYKNAKKTCILNRTGV